ncbi:hypothetical protein FH608_003065 [Nonomuraea phyllanthi]|uniref:Uncharacterized protein n=1 Tax=Nonomuraea phyllanthi TaxID=2219224 RepID=A0A5C4WXK2_9ACTN|nr:hypothetical protein [Nonomuraea phyllanthi]KAB8197546.1 hypothetical protein FH608_003065 [Nonomuraea phyllanthi]QFY06461.1 hypothetical protein GBF35_07010 [Nonomuraea phyllanthi]
MNRIAVLAIPIVSVALLAAPAGATAPKPPSYSLSGTATGTLPESFGQWAGDKVRFTIDAKSTGGRTEGTFDVLHAGKPGEPAAGDFEGKITCLVAADGFAVATGVISKGRATLPGQPAKDVTGQKVSFTVHDKGRRDTMYWMWEFLGAPINDCEGTAPLFRPSTSSFKVKY